TGTDGFAVSSYAFDDFGRNIDPFTGKVRNSRNQNASKHAYTTNGNIIQPFAFTGYQEDEVSGLKFAQARFYSADNGRFVGEDQIRGFADSPFTLNYYGYCWGNPIVLIDLDGNMPNWLEGVFAHMAIEADVVKKYSSTENDVRTNVFIEGGGIGRTKTGNGLADVVMKSGNIYSVYEIKPDSQNPATNSVKLINGMTAGEIQLAGYVKAINNNIKLGKTLGKFGSTNLDELAMEGTISMPDSVVYSPYIKNATITYSSDGNGMIYYKIDRIPKKEYEFAMGIQKQKSDAKEKIFKTIARTCYGAFGVIEMMSGVLCFVPGTALVLDDGTVVGVLDDGLAGAMYAAGTYLWLDGYHKVMKAISGCGY
ncbi:MAG: RHS repeat-associated core domain-containing protein, partial [Butyrivibrio hungatei]|nr:RHS repeat-associated core domain-containing protein [Butyrivibrio hungatei]